MTRPETERKLTTILSADVVGYSTLMSRDEAATLAVLKTIRRDLLDPKARQYRGRTIKLMGDGTLMEFASVVDALSYAVEIQHAMQDRNAKADAMLPISFRVGINIGDIIVDGDDIYGDGVNIAARLESLAEPDGICISRTVFSHVHGKLDLTYRHLGKKTVKNIPEPIDVYSVELDDVSRKFVTPIQRDAATPVLQRSKRYMRPALGLGAVALAALLVLWQPWTGGVSRASVERMAHPLPDKPSIVVLPFADLGGDAARTYFADGMTEDLITDLSKLSGIFVIARDSSWTYKDRSVRSGTVAEELGVQYILEGSVRHSAEDIRINAKLIDAIGGHHVWAERYDGQIDDVFALQDQVIDKIVSALAVQLTVGEQAGLDVTETGDMRAYDAVIQGTQSLRRGGERDVLDAIDAFTRAVEFDPGYTRAHASLATAHWRIVQSLWLVSAGGGFERSWAETLQHLDRAMQEPNALAYSVMAEIFVAQGRHAEAFDQIDRALALAPNDPDIFFAKANILNATGRAAEAEAAARQALRIDPLQSTAYLRSLGVAQLHQKRYAEAAETMRRVLAHDTQVTPDIVTLMAALGHLGELEEVPALIEQYDAIAVPSFYDPMTWTEGEYWWYGDMFGYDAEYRAHLVDGLRKAGVPGGTGTDIPAATVRARVSQAEGKYSVAGIPRISNERAKALHDAGTAIFVDVRAPADFAAGHIPGAYNLSLMTALSRETLAETASPSDTIVFSCHGLHCPYSAYAAAKADIWGFPGALYYAAGFPGWAEAGHPIETTPKD